MSPGFSIRSNRASLFFLKPAILYLVFNYWRPFKQHSNLNLPKMLCINLILRLSSSHLSYQCLFRSDIQRLWCISRFHDETWWSKFVCSLYSKAIGFYNRLWLWQLKLWQTPRYVPWLLQPLHKTMVVSRSACPTNVKAQHRLDLRDVEAGEFSRCLKVIRHLPSESIIPVKISQLDIRVVHIYMSSGYLCVHETSFFINRIIRAWFNFLPLH